MNYILLYSIFNLVILFNQCNGQESAVFKHYIGNDDYSTKQAYIYFNANSLVAVYTDFSEGYGWTFFIKGSIENNITQCEILACTEEDIDGVPALKDDCGIKVFYLNDDRSLLNVGDPDPAAHGKVISLTLDDDYSLWFDGTVNLLETPSHDAKIITSYDFGNQFDLPEELKPKILEIGPFEKDEKSVGFWYKVKTGDKTGWYFEQEKIQ